MHKIAHSITDWIDEHHDRLHIVFTAGGAGIGLVYGVLYGLYSHDRGAPILAGIMCALLFAFYGTVICSVLTHTIRGIARHWQTCLVLVLGLITYAAWPAAPPPPPHNPPSSGQRDIRPYAPLEKDHSIWHNGTRR